MLSDLPFETPFAWAAAVLAVILVGMAKGGFGGAMGLLGVPLMSLTMSPVQAAGILLPILLCMDAVSLSTWWGEWDRRTLLVMLPGGLAGVGIGWATAAFVSEDAVRVIVGAVAMLFVARWALGGARTPTKPRPHDPVAATVWGAGAGYTSFVAHAGGPPYQVYTLRLGMTPRTFTATSVMFFAIVNFVKLGPYVALGQVNVSNLTASALLMPAAALATLGGAAIVKRMRAEIFYPFMYVMVLLVAAKLGWDGLNAFL